MLLRVVTLLVLILLGCAGFASAQSRLDVAAMGSSMDLAPILRPVTTESSNVRAELPKDAAGKTDFIELKPSLVVPLHHWEILTLVNTSTAQRNLIVAIDHQKFAGSRLLYPLPPGSIVASVAHTGAFAPAKVSALGQDAFGFTLEPSTSVSLAFEITAGTPNAMLWERDAFDSLSRSIAFFRGAILGVAVLLSLSMLLLYTTRARASFLSGGIFALASVAFVALEAGYFAQTRRLFLGFEISPAEARGVIESLMSVGLLLCLLALADLRRTAPVLRNVFMGLAVVGAALPVYAFVDPLLVAAIARIAFTIIAVAGFAILFRLRLERPADSALLLWSTVVIWTFLAAMAAFSKSTSSYISPALLLGLIVVLIFISFRFAQSAASTGVLSKRLFQEAGRRGLALAGAQQYVWDWQPEDENLFVSEELEQALGHPPGTLSHATAEALLDLMHPADRGAYLATVENAERRGRGLINQELRLRRADDTYRWFELRARAMAGSDNRMVRSIGTLSDITNAKRTEERLLNDAVYDRVTGLPNRALFMDVRLRQFGQSLGRSDLSRAMVLMPSTLAPVLLATGLVIAALLLGTPHRFGSGPDGPQAAALMAFVLRDLGVVTLFRFGPRSQRGDFGAVVALALLYIVGGVIGRAMGFGEGAAFFAPLSDAPWISLVSGLVQAAIAWTLAVRRIRAPEKAR